MSRKERIETILGAVDLYEPVGSGNAFSMGYPPPHRLTLEYARFAMF